jgi:quinolinate synthase
LLPTITCTSSNVVQTILQATAQVEDLHIWFGPDTYMGRNLFALFSGLAQMDDATVAALHPDHDRASVAALLERFHYFEQGVCVVHQMFGADVAHRIERDFPDAFVTAHLEVPGEMFEVGLRAQQAGRGVVGSTSNILAFITSQVVAAGRDGGARRLRFVLGTEAGMITSIVRAVQAELLDQKSEGVPEVEVEIIFPVASEAVAATDDAALPIVPGAATGEGCSIEGGCATCPYMKMNSLDALMDMVERVGTAPESLVAYHPRAYAENVDGRTVAQVGGESILHMRHFQRHKKLSDDLVADITSRNQDRTG